MQLLDRQPAFEKRARVDAGRRVALEVDEVAFAVLRPGPEEVIEADLVERGRRRVGRDVSADAVRQPVGAHDHGHRVPAHEALDAALDLLAARERRLVGRTQGVDVGRHRRERQRHASRPGAMPQGGQQPLDAAAVTLLDDVVERFEPFPLFNRLDLGGVTRCDVFHGGPSLLSAKLRDYNPLIVTLDGKVFRS